MAFSMLSGAPARAPVTVRVETFAFSVDADGGVSARRQSGEVYAGLTPEEVARGLAGVDDDRPDVVVASTSWRMRADRLIVTYAVLPDPAPQGPGARIDGVATAGTAVTAADADIADIAAHAFRRAAAHAPGDGGRHGEAKRAVTSGGAPR